MTRAWYEFSYVHYKSMKTQQRRSSMAETNTWIMKSAELQQQLLCSSFSHISNRCKDAKDVYFGMLGYEIVMNSKHWCGLSPDER